MEAQPSLHVFLHGTPRQWDDPLRPWLAVEKNRCLANLRDARVPTTERKYFEGQPHSLLMHFESIAAMTLNHIPNLALQWELSVVGIG